MDIALATFTFALSLMHFAIRAPIYETLLLATVALSAWVGRPRSAC